MVYLMISQRVTLAFLARTVGNCYLYSLRSMILIGFKYVN
uniref:Malonyl-CoA decarboxylase n=1 Tax=Rhizophora mucronata TaxID=61149 RepID=A0A2P2LMP4_RHIMU